MTNPNLRRNALLSIALLLVTFAPALPVTAEPPQDPRCEAWEYKEGLGDVCRRDNGLYEVYAPGRGRSIGFTHGLDPAPGDGGPETPAAPRPPACVTGAAGTYYTRVFYARAQDDADQFGALVGTIRSLVEQANGLVYEAGVATGGAADIKIKCSGTTIEVTNVVLPTPKAQASFSTIVTDMENLGFTDGKVKHWVYYDDQGACTCGGTGHVYNDDSLAVGNWNNGNGAALFAVNFGWNSVRIMLHELGHNMGAVQNSAPHTTGALHCIDGLDTMCYNDGGPNGGQYSTGWCGTEVFDCGKDDYFHRNPPGGSYLASHWNLGNTMNRFLQFGGAPPANDIFLNSFLASGTSYTNSQSTAFSSSEGGEPLPCEMSATTVWYRYTPSQSGSLKVDTFGSNFDTVLAAYTGASVGALSLKACNDQFNGDQSQVTFNVVAGTSYRIQIGGWIGTTANTGSLTLHVVLTPSVDQTAPIVTLLDPVSPNVYRGCTKVGASSIRAVYVDLGCIRATITDAESGISQVTFSYQGVVLQTWNNPALATLEWLWNIPTGHMVGAEVKVTATNGAGQTTTVTTLVNHVG